MKVSVIITTYNAEDWLRKVLVGFSVQTETDFELVIADDGSTPKTKEVLDAFSSQFKHPIVHVWHEDDGFQKSKILNKAILKTNSDYLLFTDGDCIPRKDFVAVHLKYKEEGYFLSGGYFKLPMTISQAITDEDIISQNCFRISWLRRQGLKMNFKITKLTHTKLFADFMNWVTPTKRSWNGHNSSGFKSDILAVNGFNHDMKYGGLDRELGERLFNLGLFSKQIRYSAICLHLDHARGYSSPEIWEKNNAIRTYNRKHKVIQIENGISSL
ncbi:glycosyltransferase family 2 protein [Flavobacterium sp. XGLA_31]|uniref:glycosyltransferase family 2 protein n=1 Tax=Flavobacterium sp. XGLA_31 TaxID=3447666 RepID=UPI003F3C3727